MIKLKWLIVSILAFSVCLFTSSGFSISKVEASSSQWTVTYFSKLNFKGSKVEKKASTIHFSWGEKAPVKGISPNYFSAKMTKTLSVSSGGKYRISGKANDGIRIYVDGKKRSTIGKRVLIRLVKI